MKTCPLIIGVALLAIVQSGAKDLATAPGPETVIVPYDPTKPVAQQQPDQFYLPYERFLQLWEAAKAHRTGKKPESAPLAYALSAARYEGTVGGRAAAFVAKLDVTTYNEPWVKVPLPFEGVRISALKIDGVAAAYDGGQIIIEKPGRHQVEVAFEIPLPAGASALEWQIPRTAATLLVLALPDERAEATVTPSGGVIERVEQGRKRVTAALGATDRVRVEWKTATATRLAEAPAATITTQLLARLGREETRTEFAFAFAGGRQDRFTIHFPASLALEELDAPGVKSWRLLADGSRQALEVVLDEPAADSYALRITTGRALPALPAELEAPVFSAAARRIDYAAFAFCIGDRLELTPQPAEGQRRTTWDHTIGAVERVVAAYTGGGPARYRLAIPAAQREARVDYVYQVNRRKIELIASLKLRAQGDDLSTLTLGLPAQYEIQAVESARLQDWWRDGDTLHLRFRGPTPEVTPLVVYLVRQYAAAPTALEVRPLVLEGFRKVTGEAVIAAHKGVAAAMTLNAEGREVAPEQAATDFQILPPLERQRGFTFKTQDFSGQITLAPLPARTTALWVMHAQAHEGWVALSTHAQLTLRQGSLDRATFTLPAAAPEARVSGPEVRETRTRVEGDRRFYEVQFQNDVYESVEFTIDAELPNPGAVPLPAIAFPEAQMTSGFVLADNVSDFEMKLQTTGVDPAPEKEVPFLPELTKTASLFRAQPDWAVTVGLERLEKAATRAAFVAWAELTTALRRDGTEWHRATYRLQNRSLQFLPVKLPAGAELMSARVAGQNVRADAGTVGGTAAILVPLIKTKPGDLSYDVELVYRVPGAAPGWWARRGLDDPELLGVTVERTFWNVWVPDERKLQNSSGNMEPVLAEVNKADKLEGALQELSSLVSVARSGSVSEATRANAYGNIERLRKDIEAENRDDRFADSYRLLRQDGKDPSPTPAEETVGKKGLAQQGAYIANKRREITEQLGREVQKLAEVGKVRPQSQTATVPEITFTGPLGSGAVQGESAQRWKANRSDEQQRQSATLPAAGQRPAKNNFYFNDNVVLNSGVVIETKPAEQPAKAAADDLAQKLPAAKSEAASNVLDAKLKKGGDGALREAKKESLSALSTARGNSQRVLEEQPLAPAPAAAASALPQLQLLQGTATRGGFAGTGSGVSADKVAARLQPAGRLSLAVDFPTEGRLYHFKKVKANAQLELTTFTPESFTRWKCLALALVLAAILAGLGRLAGRRAAAH